MSGKLDFEKIRHRKVGTIPSRIALNDVTPFEWNEEAVKNKDVKLLGGNNKDVQKA